MIGDLTVSPRDLQQLGTADAVAAFFARLGYQTNARTPQPPANLGITAEGTVRSLRRVELIADNEGLQVYLFEVSSVTLSLTRALARTFRNRAGNYLLVLTSDYEQIDFVLLERYLSSMSHDALGIGTPHAGIRPRVLTVERRNPSRASLRALRRFVFAGSDGYGQYERLRAAYDVADWSEDFFNNRGLFSDYYLLERLRENPAWVEDPKPAFLRLREVFRSASDVSGQPEEPLRRLIVEPTLEILGFRFRAGERAGGEGVEPDYLLSTHAGLDTTMAACLAYSWGRSLDGKDEHHDRESPEENPGAIVVSLLENGKVPWVIVTNGKQWRLYSAKAHSRATNYYEVDLEEAVTASIANGSDSAEAFRYFWLFFRQQAFEPAPVARGGATQTLSFLDLVLAESEDYAKELGERLKERVFTQTFPHLVEGFITSIHQRDGRHTAISQKRLDEIYQGTLTLLYRLLFLLYAEARDLLPVREVRGYWAASLARLKREIADAVGPIADEADGRLRKRFSQTDYELYDRLGRLFEVIDQGDPDLNVPTYDGGLFISLPDAKDDSPEGANARFLRSHKVPNYHLARALDLLARDEDPKRHDLVAIDYKSLGVRHLGSIYEGLLEFRVRIADRTLAIVKEKGREVYVSLAGLSKSQGERAEHHGRVINKGQAYLENDRRERKATGSYYTPDYIVNYIVQHTVGPVLREKFEALRSKLRDAQRRRQEFFKRQDGSRKAHVRPEPSEKADLIGQELVAEMFDLKVLDPAMGSGHFLVEAVDFITDKILDFLNAFPWNPVFTELHRTRQTILKEMAERGITIDERRLTEVNLLKRHVLKRCIYGVDLNPMAVELAKVSLWLDCFTLGAPLSFLDHHLRCGNALIGVTVAEVDEIRAREGQLQLSESSDWQGLQQAIQGMILVGGLPDATATQVDTSRTEYRRASNLLTPFKRILDIHTARWFDGGVFASKRKENGSAVLDEILKSGDLFNWASGRAAYMFDTEQYQLILRTTERISHERRFFHWELEFPEVFYGSRLGKAQTFERLKGAGFDAVIGNPPYINVKRGMEDALKRYLEHRYALAIGQWDQGALFYELALGSVHWPSIASIHASVGLIVPKPFFLSESYQALRALLMAAGSILYGPCGECFADSGVEASICIVDRRSRGTLCIVDGRQPPSFLKRTDVPIAVMSRVPFAIFTYMLPERAFFALYAGAKHEKLVPLSELVEWTRGVEAGKGDLAVSRTKAPGTHPLIVGEAMTAFAAPPTAWIRVDLHDEKKFKLPTLYRAVPKLLVRRVAQTLIAAVDETGAYVLNTIYIARAKGELDPYAAAALLNSALARGILRATFNMDDTLFPYIRVSQLDRLLVPLLAMNDATLARLGRLLSSQPEEAKRDVRIMELETRVRELYGLEPDLADAICAVGATTVAPDVEGQQ